MSGMRGSQGHVPAPMRYVVVGGGMAGVSAAQRLRALDPASSLVLIEAEPVPYYLRPGLIDVLAGKKELREITPYPKDWFEKHGIHYLLGEAAVELDLLHREVVLASDKRVPYERLLLALGAEPIRRAIPGVELPGVFTLRTAADVERIRTWVEGRKQAVVLGGGWLGLEAAYALGNFRKVVVLDRGAWPLPRHLDREGGEVLAELLRGKGVEFRGETEAVEIRGSAEVREVRLLSGEVLAADMVLIAIGIRPRAALARDAGIAVNRGILVNEFLETTRLGVYAAGDAVEWQGRVYGIIPAAREQAQVAAQNMVEPGSARYGGTPPSQRLKVAGVDLLCLGETQPRGGPLRELRRADPEHARYLKFVVDREGRLVGAVLLGAPDLAAQVEAWIRDRAHAEGEIGRILARPNGSPS